MKNAKFIIIGIACICLICTGFYFFTQENKETEKNLTEIEKVIVKDLKNNYPKTPRGVVSFYNKIVKCYYGDEPTDEQLNDLVDQMMFLLDDDLILVNPRDAYYDSVVKDISKYKEEKKQLVNTKVCSTNEVDKIVDDKGDGSKKDELAYVDASYLINTDGQFAYTYQQFVLRKDEDGHWKILTFYMIEGDESEND